MFEHRALRRIRFLAFAIAICGLACYGGATSAATRPPMAVGPDVGAFVYGCAANANFCNVYVSSGNVRGSVTTGLLRPLGIGVDSAGKWYVANSGMSDILVFPGGRTNVVATLSDAGEVPGDVAAGRNQVAVSNLSGTSATPASVTVYRDGATTPTEVLHYGPASRGISIALDFYGNCYWSFSSGTSGGGIVEFPRCSTDRTPVLLNLTIASPGGLAFDRDHDLWYIDRAEGVFRCKSVRSCKLVVTGFVNPNLMKFDEHGDDLLVMDDGYGIYRISGIGQAGGLQVHPLLTTSPFAPIPPSEGPSGVAAGGGL